jgi:branched-chain amino acid transport system ATP-binding protein
MSIALEISGLDAGYGGVPMVRGLDLRADRGEVVALLGPNGAGKTTTLLTVSGLLPALGGVVTVLGEPVSARRPQQVVGRGVAHVPEDGGLFFGLTVAENLRLATRDRAAIAEALDELPALKPLLGRRTGLLSGGEQQMVSLARALAMRPRLLMVDELSLGLAPRIVERLLPLLQRVARDREMCVLMVEQHVELALEIADRAYVMAHGRVVLEGQASALAGSRELLESSYMGESGLAAIEEQAP